MSGSNRTLRRIVLASLLVGAVVWNLSQRVPCGPSAGTLAVAVAAARVPANEPARLKIGTYNIHSGKGLDGVYDLYRIADVVRGLDFVGLNEVRGPAFWERDDQATALGRELRLTPLFAPTEERWRHLRFGNGLLTRIDVDAWQVVPLPRREVKSFRNLVHVRARAANGVAVNLVVTHLHHGDDVERHEQLRTVANFFLSLAEPAVLLGDLNSDASEPELQRLLDQPRTVDALSAKYGLKAPPHIDWIVVRGAEVIDAGLVPAGPSDHPHVWAELSVPSATKGVLFKWEGEAAAEPFGYKAATVGRGGCGSAGASPSRQTRTYGDEDRCSPIVARPISSP